MAIDYEIFPEQKLLRARLGTTERLSRQRWQHLGTFCRWVHTGRVTGEDSAGILLRDRAHAGGGAGRRHR